MMESFSELVQLHSEINAGLLEQRFEFRIGCFQCGANQCWNENPSYSHDWWVEACLVRKDTHSDMIERGYGGKIAIPMSASRDVAAKKFFVAARDFAEHEIREGFTWKGKAILGPHIDLDTMWEAIDE